MNKTVELIRMHNPFDEKPGCEGFIGRREFVNRTGILVSPNMYDENCKDFIKLDKSVAEFLRDFKRNKKNAIRVLELTGKLKYLQYDCVMDGYGWQLDEKERYNPSIYEIVDCLLRNSCLFHNQLIESSRELQAICNDLAIYEMIKG